MSDLPSSLFPRQGSEAPSLGKCNDTTQLHQQQHQSSATSSPTQAAPLLLHEVLQRLATYTSLVAPDVTVPAIVSSPSQQQPLAASASPTTAAATAATRQCPTDERRVQNLLAMCMRAVAEANKLGAAVVPTDPHAMSTRQSPLLKLNLDALTVIITFLPASNVEQLSLVSTSFLRLVRRSEPLWKELCGLSFPRFYKEAVLCFKPQPSPGQAVWRNVYKARHMQDDPWWDSRPCASRVIQGQRGVHSILFDKTTLLSGSGVHHEIVAIDLRTGLKHNGPSGAGLYGHQQAVTGMKLLPHAPNYLVTSSLDCTLRLFNRERMAATKIYNGHTDKVWCFDVLDQRIFSGGSDRTIRIWDIDKASEVIAPLAGHRTSISALRVLTDAPNAGNMLMTGSSGTTIRAWDLGKGGDPQCMLKLRGHLKGVFCLQQACGLLLSGSLDNVIKAWDPRQSFRHVFDLIEYDESEHPIISPTHETDNNVGIISFSCDDTKVASGGPDKVIKLWDLRMRRMVRTFVGHEHWVTTIQIDSGKIVSGSRDKTVMLWDINGRMDETVHPSIGVQQRLQAAAPPPPPPPPQFGQGV